MSIEVNEGVYKIKVDEDGKKCTAIFKPEIVGNRVSISMNIDGDIDACQTLINRYFYGFIDLDEMEGGV